MAERHRELLENNCPITNPWEGGMMPVPSELSGEQPIDSTKPAALIKKPIQPVELSVSIDKSKLSTLDLPPQVEHLRDTYLKLPDQLDFSPGVNLIFGSNGSGKTTIARAIYFALKAKERYNYRIEAGGTEEEADKEAQEALETPRFRGTEYEEYLSAGVAPMIARALKLLRYQNNTPLIYGHLQGEVGRKEQLLREMARQPSIRDVGGFFEFGESRHDTELLKKQTENNGSARQTVDSVIGDYLDAISTPRYDTVGILGDWNKPEEFSLRDHPERKPQKYAPGVSFLDEPETGLDVRRHLELPDSIQKWSPPGSIMVIPSNSTELFRSELPRLDLSEPEKGIHTP